MKKGFVSIFVIAAFLITFALGVGVFYHKTGGFKNLNVEKNLPISTTAEKRWTLVDHTNEVSFIKELDERSFIGMNSNGDYWLLGRGYSSYSPNHLYKYTQKGRFENLSAQISALDEVWYTVWNGKNWLLGNANYTFSDALLFKYDGKEFTNLTEEFKKAPCESTYEGHINISNIFAMKSAFLVVSQTDLTACYAFYDGSNFQNISEIFPKYPSGSGREGDRMYYTLGECYEDICYLISEDGGDSLIKFDAKNKNIERIAVGSLIKEESQNSGVAAAKSNKKGEWLFQVTNFDDDLFTSSLVSFDSTTNIYTVLNKGKTSLSRLGESYALEGWDGLVSKWVLAGFDCSAQNEKLCRLTFNHLEGDKIVKLPIELPQSESEGIPIMSISDGSYFVSYDDKLFEIVYK